MEGYNKIKMVTIQKVVSRNFILDLVASFQNIIGLNLTSYEKMVKKGVQQIQEDLAKDKIQLKWYRYEITQLTNGAIAIVLYGDRK